MTERYLLPQGLDLLFQMLHERGTWAVDTETNGLDPYKGSRIWGVSLYHPATDRSFYIPVRYLNEYNVPTDYYQWVLRHIAKQPRLVFFNAKFDLHMLYVDGMPEPLSAEDVMIAARLLNENEWLSNGGKAKGAYQLKRLARKYLGEQAVVGEETLIANAVARGIDPKSGMWQMPAADVALYAMMDTEITWQLLQVYTPGLERWGQYKLYEDRSMFQLKSLMRMEVNGMPVNVETIQEHRRGLEPKMAAMQAKFDDRCKKLGIRLQAPDKKGEEKRWVNLNSAPQLKSLFQLSGYDVEATNKYVLRDLSEAGVQLAKDVSQYRLYSMADQMFYSPYLEFVTDEGIIHHSLNTNGTKTGRLSSDHPNFQQVPKGNEKYIVKQVFVPRPGYVMVQFDYKALEFRLATHFAEDALIREAFLIGLDPHQDTADRLGLTRSAAKTLNFALLYGMGGEMYAKRTGMPLKQAIKQVQAWHKQYPSFRRTLAKYEKLARQWRNPDGSVNGKYQFVRVQNNKVKHFNEFVAYPEYEPEYRSAFNFKVQGTAAVVAEESIQKVNLALPDNEIWKPVNAVHDALMGEIKIGYVNQIVPIIIKIMEDWPDFNPRLEVEAQISDTTWYDMRDYKPEEW